MNTKGLFRVVCFIVIAAGLLLPARAQSTFSANMAAYVDVNLVAGTNLIASPLNVAHNTISNLFSQPLLNRVPDGSYFISLDAASPTFGISNHYSSVTGWNNANDVLVAPNAAVLWLPSATRITFIGEPWSANNTGPSCLTYPQGLSFSGWFPQNICGICENPAGDCPIFPDGTTISKWNTNSQRYDDYTYFDNFGSPAWIPSMPQIGMSEGFQISAPQSFTAHSAFATTFAGSPLRHGRPFDVLRDVHRDGTNLTFRFAATNGTLYSLLWTTNIRSGVWQIVPQALGGTGGGFATNTVAMTNRSALFKVHPPYTGPNPILVPRVTGRGAATFSFDFYAPTGTTYQIDRVLSLAASPLMWTNIANISAASNTFVTFTDTTATAPSGYYRVRY